MTGLERVLCALRHEEPDRVPLSDNLWTDTLVRFRREGMPQNVAPEEYFDYDITHLSMDLSPRLDPAQLADEGDTLVIRDRYGYVVRKFRGKDRGMQWLEHPLARKADWERIKARMIVDLDGTSRLDTEPYFMRLSPYPDWGEARRRFEAVRATGRFITVFAYGPHEIAWRLRGWERILMDTVEDPQFVADIYATVATLTIDTLQRAQEEGIRPDAYFMADDLAYTRAPFFAPAFYRGVLWPQHRRIGQYLQSQGLTYMLHTDGQVTDLIPDFIDAGVQVLQPLEAKAGLDVRDLKGRYPQMTWMGNIDMRRMSGDLAQIEEEVRNKVGAAKRGGGYIYHSDHSVPSEVSLANYEHLLACVRKVGAAG